MFLWRNVQLVKHRNKFTLLSILRWPNCSGKVDTVDVQSVPCLEQRNFASVHSGRWSGCVDNTRLEEGIYATEAFISWSTVPCTFAEFIRPLPPAVPFIIACMYSHSTDLYFCCPCLNRPSLFCCVYKGIGHKRQPKWPAPFPPTPPIISFFVPATT
jgi:hypothetical protein